MAVITNTIELEKDTIKKMINLYCRKNHSTRETPCRQCQDLLTYAWKRLDACKFGNNKPTCEKCPIHCYQPGRRKAIKKVMRFSGPRMIFVHPVDAIRHLLKNMNKFNLR